MSCKPGDLAVVVRPSKTGNPPSLGVLVLVDRRCDVFLDCWRLSPPCIDPRDGREVSVPDDVLRPIRDPGDDARDETLEWLPAPSRDEVTA